MAEVFSWPEASLYLFSAGAGSSALYTFGQDISLDVDYKLRRTQTTHTGAPASRTKLVVEDKVVRLRVGALFADQSAFQAANSATAWNARLVFAVTGGLTQTGEFQLWSANFTHWGLAGNDNGIWKARVEMEAVDMSGIW